MSGYGPPRGWRGSNAWAAEASQRPTEDAEVGDHMERLRDMLTPTTKALILGDGDVRADAFDLDVEELVEIFADFIGQWDRSHEVITVGLPDHLPQLRIPHLRRAVVALQRLGRERGAALEATDGDARAVAAFLASDQLGPAMAALHDHFADRIAALDARDKKAV